jgi:predicted SnoaL-like aldol condensation-catalyzing enzyme
MSNKEMVLSAYRAVFRDRDGSAVDRYWGPQYIQHNPNTPNGLDGLRQVAGALPAGFTWEPGILMEDGDLVMLQSRSSGLGPKPQIRVEIVRVENGKMVEHWDVSQDEVTETVSGNPMFTPRPE